MKEEVKSACNFLASLLKLRAVCSEKTDIFSETLQALLGSHYQNHWFPEKPFKGSGYRCLRINHKLDPLVVIAAGEVGILENDLRSLLPAELTMWIDPLEVSYRIGEHGSECILYSGDNQFNSISSNNNPLQQHYHKQSKEQIKNDQNMQNDAITSQQRISGFSGSGGSLGSDSTPVTKLSSGCKDRFFDLVDSVNLQQLAAVVYS